MREPIPTTQLHDETERLRRRHRIVSRVLAATVALIGFFALIGWFFGLGSLVRVVPGAFSMKVNTAIGLFLSGFHLAVFWKRRPLPRVIPLIVVALGVATMFEYWTGIDLGIDELFVRDSYAEVFGGAPGRMAAPAAMSFVMVGAALWLLRGPRYRLWQGLVLGVMAMNLVGLLGYLYGVETIIYLSPIRTGIAAHTTLAFILLSLSVLFSRPDVGVTRVLASSYAGGRIARRLLPAVTIVFIVVGFLLRWLERTQRQIQAIDIDLVVAIGVIIMGWLIWRNARELNEHDSRTSDLTETIREAERRLQLIMDSVPVLISYVNSELRYEFVNASYTRWFGPNAGEIIGRSLVDVLGREAYEGLKDKIDPALAGETVEIESEVPYAGAGTRYVLATYVPDVSPEGAVRGFYAVISDISERRKAERELQKARDELEMRVQERTQELEIQSAIVRNMGEGACMIRASDGVIIYANPSFERIFGYGRGELEGRFSGVLYDAPDSSEAGRIAREISETVERKCVHTYEVRNVRKNGTAFWSKAASVVLDHPRHGLVIIAVHEDITERRNTEIALRRSEERFAMLIDQATEGIFIADASGRYTDVNRAAFEMLGYPSKEDLVGRRIVDLIPPEEVPRLEAERSRIFGGATVISDWKLRRKDGSYIDAEVSAKALPDGRWIAFARDIGERKRFERSIEEKVRDLARSNAELEQFAYVASHDLREPLRIVTNYAQLLERRYKGKLDESADRYIRHMVDGVARMQALIGDLLTYSRVGRVGAEPVEIDLDDVAHDVTRGLAAAIEESGATVRFDPLPTVLASGSEMRQLLQNLVSNAIKFRRKGVRPEVHVSAQRFGDRWVISVQDNGIGIEPRYHDRIFVIFQRLHGREEYPGTGIGLAICKKIVERLGGRIWLDSRPGSGSTFFFSLPAPAEAVLRRATA